LFKLIMSRVVRWNGFFFCLGWSVKDSYTHLQNHWNIFLKRFCKLKFIENRFEEAL
jgi:hypothetical protein